ncbi:MAG: bifunctional ADP-dependent NAD(P)H-hydrate dehydratase/NAD(P)H-hydrate epimerase, partial [Bacteroidales bacterium]|nr:bifunctional ADP-dependent NAD(P)H-hydrate dehydratase/NAD(P)H-hydrate epimerase [Bacteroidales bacterium]
MVEEIKFVAKYDTAMKIFRSDQIREIDAYTIKNEPVASSDLMERAASKLCEWFTQRFQRSRHILIFAGPGNNGGDGLTMARLLAKDRYDPEVYYVNFTDNVSGDWKTT